MFKTLQELMVLEIKGKKYKITKKSTLAVVFGGQVLSIGLLYGIIMLVIATI